MKTQMRTIILQLVELRHISTVFLNMKSAVLNLNVKFWNLLLFSFHKVWWTEWTMIDGPIQRWLEYLYYNCTAFQILNIKLLNADVSISFVLLPYNCCNKTCLLFTFCYHICINCDRFWEYLINFNPPFKDSTILH